MSENIKSKLDKLKELCDYTEKQLSSEQNDDNLVGLLNSEYKLSKPSLKSIIELVSGKKQSSKISNTEKKELMLDLEGNCILCRVNFYDKDKITFVGFEKLRHRISQKKNGLKE